MDFLMYLSCTVKVSVMKKSGFSHYKMGWFLALSMPKRSFLLVILFPNEFKEATCLTVKQITTHPISKLEEMVSEILNHVKVRPC